MSESNPKRIVLLVDDDKFLVDMYSMKFTQNGYTVQAFLSVHDALEELRRGFSPDAVMFDLVMPERDGFAFLAALREEHLVPSAIKIALSNQSDDADRKKAIELGADNYIIKASMIPSEVVDFVSTEIKKKASS